MIKQRNTWLGATGRKRYPGDPFTAEASPELATTRIKPRLKTDRNNKSVKVNTEGYGTLNGPAHSEKIQV